MPDMHREVSRVKLAKMPALRDISAYLSELPMLTQPERGSGSELVLGGRIYRAICAECHGVMGLGDGESPMPNLRGQHYSYLLQQGRLLAAGHRYSVDAQVSALLEFLSMRELTAVSDYISRMADSSESRASNDADGSEFQPALMHFWFAEIVVTSKPIAACDGRRRADDRAERVHVEYPKYLLGSSTYSAARKGLHDQLMQQSCHQPFGRRGLTCRMPCCAN
ncbi:MAG: c-type cytochrome [Rhizobiaceae bacterium]|nr:MAG: c-type cytochrome [Rhizobiaceae bacterium]